jgi:hypothetical protein
MLHCTKPKPNIVSLIEHSLFDRTVSLLKIPSVWVVPMGFRNVYNKCKYTIYHSDRVRSASIDNRQYLIGLVIEFVEIPHVTPPE